ncbi:putative estradiol 17 beta-dehydrogenase [Xylariaceae sp. FL1272]|nr:putative estradiol 17 beta-dehydrogenase [Xylariaceae sp. FL1272]
MAPNKSFDRTQFFPPKPQFTVNDVPELRGKVFVVTGGNSGMGIELARVLYSKDAKVYITCRSEEKGALAIKSIQTEEPKSKGELVFVRLELGDLTNVQAAAKTLLSKESQAGNKIHGLFNNAGVMVNPSETMTKTAQGYEEGIGVNCVGTFLFTMLLTPLLVATAKVEPADTVRVVWLSSFGLEQFAPEGGAMDLDNLDFHIPKPGVERYGLSKVGSWLQAVEYARRHCPDGIVSVAVNPGNIKTTLARNQGMLLKMIVGAITYPVINGVCTQLFAAFSPEITTKFDWKTKWVIPFGRVANFRPDLTKAVMSVQEGGNDTARKFWQWNKDQVKDYLN